MAGNFPGRDRRGGFMADERSHDHPHAHNDERYGRRFDEERSGASQTGGGRDRSADPRRAAPFDEPSPRYDRPADSRDEGRQRSTSTPRGSGNYAADWMRDPPGIGNTWRGPDHARGGGFGGPQDSYSRGTPDDDAPGAWRGGLGNMPGSLPAGRGGEQYGRGADRSIDTGSGQGRSQDDGRGGPSFRGMGPKGYQRSDERLKEIVCEKLCDDERIDAREIVIEVQNGEVTLEGRVSERAMKYRVEDLVEQCGAKEIHNRLRVGEAGSEQASNDKRAKM